jgi:ABC-2 type transport system permease protein
VRLALVYGRLQVLELVRFPGFTIATLAFPALLFLLFGLPRADGNANLLLASYAAFSVLGVGFFQFGVSTAIERVTAWHTFVRTLPAPAASRFAGRTLAALVFAGLSAAIVIAVSLATTSASLTASEWARLCIALVGGSLPFVLLGLAIAYWTSPKTALPAANILYLLLSYAGGLWTGPSDLPHAVRVISNYTPTRQWGDVLWPSVLNEPWSATHWLALAAYAAGFGAIAAWGYRRDEGQRFE